MRSGGQRTPPSLSDGIIVLDAFTLSDIDAQVAGEDEVHARRFGWYPERSTPESVGAYIRDRSRDWASGGVTRAFAVREASTRSLVGGCEIRQRDDRSADMSYWTLRAYRGRGFATRAVLLASAFAFAELGLERLELRIEPDNLASRAVAHKAGFLEHGSVRSQPRAGGERRDLLRYTRSRTDAPRRRAESRSADTGGPQDASPRPLHGPGRNLVVRAATPADAPAVADVHIRSWQWAYRGQLPDAFLDGLSATIEHRTAVWHDMLSSPSRDERPWVADLDGKIVGFVSAGPSRDADAPATTGEVYAIYLDESAVGQGVGRTLFARAVAFLREHGHGAATLWVLGSNARARHFYERAGWQPDGGIKDEARDGFELSEIRYRVTLAGRVDA